MSETTKRRGRPLSEIGMMAKDPEYAQIFGKVSERQMMNHAYAQIGVAALGQTPDGSAVDAEFRWLFDPSKRVCRSSLLAEIGRIVGEYADPSIGERQARAVARVICERKPSVAKGRALIRAWRIDGLMETDPVESLARVLVRAVASWSETHESLEIESITQAMQRALCLLSETVSENALEQFEQAVQDRFQDTVAGEHADD